MTARTRSPWIVWAIAMVLLASTFTLSALNGRLAEEGFFNLIPLAIVLVYSTVGALLASRDPGNRIGRLMMMAGLATVLGGFGEEYLIYGLETRPGSLPGSEFGAVLSNLAGGPLLVALVLVVLLFPTGRVPGPRWKFLPPTMFGLLALVVAGTVLKPGPIDAVVIVVVENPMGVEVLDNVANLARTIGFLGLLPALAAAIVALILRFRRSRGEERQQIRWLVYVVAVVGLLILISIVQDLLLKAGVLGDVLFVSIVVMAGIGVPAAIGIAILKYRLYELDVVVKKTVLYAIVALLLIGTFLVFLVTIGKAAIEADPFTVAALVAMGVAVWPVVRLAHRVADRVVYRGRATPYQALTTFSHRVADTYGSEDVMPRMATILRETTRAQTATVWLRVSDVFRPTAVSGETAHQADVRSHGGELPALPGDHVAAVRHQGETLGALVVTMPSNDPIDSSRIRLVDDLAAQAGAVLRNVRLIEDLRASRQRLVAAQDEERRKLERNIHDGAQQQLVALAVKLRLADGLIDRDPAKTHELLAQLHDETNHALEDIRDLARGIYPPLLADQGLPAALAAQSRKSAMSVSVRAEGVGRYRQEIEAAVYFSCLEALSNTAKYAEATHADVRLEQSDGVLTFSVADDGLGFDQSEPRHGTGLQGMADRLNAIGGDVQVVSTPGGGTTVTGTVPAEARMATP